MASGDSIPETPPGNSTSPPVSHSKDHILERSLVATTADSDLDQISLVSTETTSITRTNFHVKLNFYLPNGGLAGYIITSRDLLCQKSLICADILKEDSEEISFTCPSESELEIYRQVIQLMHSEKSVYLKLRNSQVGQIVRILKASIQWLYHDGIVSCLRLLDVKIWHQHDVPQVISALHQLPPDDVVVRYLLQRLPAKSSNAEALVIYFNLLADILSLENEFAQNKLWDSMCDIVKIVKGKQHDEELFQQLSNLFDNYNSELKSICLAATSNMDTENMEDEIKGIEKAANRIILIFDILIAGDMGEKAIQFWVQNAGLLSIHHNMLAAIRFPISTITAELFNAIGEETILATSELKQNLLNRWLDAFYQDFELLVESFGSGIDLVEKGLCQTIIGLSSESQEKEFWSWYHLFREQGKKAPDLCYGFSQWYKAKYDFLQV